MALSILEHGGAGEFLVRDKKGEPNCYALSVKVIFLHALIAH